MALGALYPVRVEATLDPQVSRWLWLVKWLLALPHYVVLSVLWIAFFVLSVVAFLAILVTGRYPPAIFEFNVGVLRWTWRVAYYSYGALATDRYPPFSLAEVPDYPTHLEVAYPEHLSRGLVLVKWWLLAIPHYLVVGFLVGGAWAAWDTGHNALSFGSGGLIGLLVLVAAIVLAITGRYPQPLFDLILGLNRWVLRVAAYAALMTDEYPPFRLDMGGHEGGAAITAPERPGPGRGGGVIPWPDGPMPVGGEPPAGPAAGGGAPPGGGPGTAAAGGGGRAWTAGRIVSLALGSLLALTSLGLLAGSGAATWVDNTQRDPAGYLTSGEHLLATGSYAITTDRIELGAYSDALSPASLLGTVRIRVTPVDPARPAFVGVGPRLTVGSYLAGLSHAVVADWSNGSLSFRQGTGDPPAVRPAAAAVWTASASGAGTQTLTWKATAGSWVVVVMNADGSPGVSVSADVGATVPSLGWIAAGLLVAGGVLLAAAVVLVAVPVARAGRRSPSGVVRDEEPVSYRRAG